MPRVLFLLMLFALPLTASSDSQPVQLKPSQDHSSDVDALFLNALALQQEGRREQAASAYLNLIKRHPDLPEPRNNLAKLYMEQGRYDDAIDLLVATLNTHPAYATAWQNLKILYQGLASEAYRKALSKEKNPRSVMDQIHLTTLTRLYNTPSRPTPAIVTASAQPMLAQKPEDANSAPEPAAPRAANTASTPTPAHMMPAKPAQTAAKSQAKARPAIKITPVAVTPSQQELVEQVKRWAEAWSTKDFKRYVDAYLPDYKGGKRSHKAWLDYRRSRIVRPGFIRVEVDRFKLKSASSQRAIIDFRQRFTSPNYKDRVIKRLYLNKTANGWKISREKTLSVL